MCWLYPLSEVVSGQACCCAEVLRVCEFPSYWEEMDPFWRRQVLLSFFNCQYSSLPVRFELLGNSFFGNQRNVL